MSTFRRFLLPVIMLLAIAGGMRFAKAAAQATDLDGYAWSDDIGWISMNCVTGGANQTDICGVSNYKVSIGPTGDLIGYGWNDNIGWVKFGGLSGMPNSGANAKYNSANGAISGFVRFCSGMYGPSRNIFNNHTINNTCTGTTRTDGWDGWLSLSGKSPYPYGITMASNGLFYGYGWGDDNVGWVDFSGVRKLNATSIPEDIKLFVAAAPIGNLQFIYTETFNTNPAPPATDPATIQMGVGANLKYTYQTQGATSCSMAGAYPATNLVLPSAASGTLVPQTAGRLLITLNCTMLSGAQLTKTAIVDVLDEIVVVDPHSLIVTAQGQVNATHATLRYYSGGTLPGSCVMRSYKPNYSHIAPPHTPTGGYGDPDTNPDGEQDWTPNTTVTYKSSVANGTRTFSRETTSTRYLVECVGKLSGNLIYDYTDVGVIETVDLIVTATPNSVPQGGATTIAWSKDPANSSILLSSCTANAHTVTGVLTPVSVAGWNAAPAVSPYSVANPPFNKANVPVPGTAGRVIRYSVTCTDSNGLVVTGSDDVTVTPPVVSTLALNIREASPTPGAYAPTITMQESLTSAKVDLSWTASNPAAFVGKQCYTGTQNSGGQIVNRPFEFIYNGTVLPAPIPAAPWTTTMGASVTGLAAPGASVGGANEMKNVAIASGQYQTTQMRYWISCEDINGAIQTASATVNFSRAQQAADLNLYIRETGGNYAPSVNVPVSGAPVQLTWTTSNPALYPANSCRAGAASPSNNGALYFTNNNPSNISIAGWTNGSGLNAPGLSTGSPNQSGTLNAPGGTNGINKMEFWITCTDINNVTHFDSATVNYDPRIQPPSALIDQFEATSCNILDVPPTTDITWSTTGMTSCEEMTGTGYHTGWMGSQFGATSGSVPNYPLSTLPITIGIRCFDDERPPNAYTATQTIQADCSVSSGGPKKPIFEEF